MARLIKLITSCFYLGFIPAAPGTFGSLFGLGIYFLIYGNNLFYLIVTLLFALLGFLTCPTAVKIFGQKDPGRVVIDEAAGLLVAFFLIPPQLFYLITGFLLYRFFDIVKPYPLRKLERINSPAAIMLDDLGAGIYTNLLLQCLHFLINI